MITNQQHTAVNEQSLESSDLTRTIIGCAMKVHSKLGCGFQEVIYQRSLAIELNKAGIDFSREHEMPIYYDDELVGTRRVDFLVANSISVEIKALTELEDIHLAQAKNYLEAYNLRVGLLLNFGAKSLEFRRLMNSKAPPRDEKSLNVHPRNPTPSA